MQNADYFVGLVDGEGSFNVQLNSSKRRRAKVEMRFSLKLRAEDKEILDAMREFFACGNVYRQIDKRPNHSLCFRYEVQNRTEIIEQIIPFFEKHPVQLASKQRDFHLFKEIVKLVKANADKTEEGMKELLALKEKMH